MTEVEPRSPRLAARRQQIVDALNSYGFVSVNQLARDLGASDMTIRRDLRKLEESGIVRVVHGGVSLPYGPANTASFAARARVNAEGKRRIAEHAWSLVGADEAIAIDAGTTTHALAQTIPDRFQGTIVTHSVPIIQLVLSHRTTSLVALGGDLRHQSQAFVGPMTVDNVARLRVRTLFLGAAAIDHRGAYVSEDVERPTKSALMEIADQTVLLADNNKFSASAPVLLCKLSSIDVVITDMAPPDAVLAQLDADNVRLDVA